MEKRVFRILPLTGNQALVSAGTTLYNLSTGALNILEGQLGIFDYYTKTAVNTASLGNTKSIFFARRNGDSIVQSLKIDLNQVYASSKQCAVAAVPEKWKVTWTRTDCNETYLLKVGASSVEIMEALGHNILEKTFSYTTDCCKDCEGGCGDGDCSKVAENLVASVNADPDKLFSANLEVENDFAIDTESLDVDFAEEITITIEFGGTEFVFTGTFATIAALSEALQIFLNQNSIQGTVTVSGSIITINNTNISSLVFEGTDSEEEAIDEEIEATGQDSCPSVVITANFKGITEYCGLNPDYVFPNGVRLIVTPIEKFGCVADVQKIQNLVIGQGAGYDWADSAEQASGLYQNSPYRFAPSIRPDDLRFNLVDKSINYVSYSVSHFDKHEGAPSGHYFDSELVSIILVPSTGSTTLTALDTAFNNLFKTGASGC